MCLWHYLILALALSWPCPLFPLSIPLHVYMLSCFHCVWLFATLWTVAHQDPLSMGFSRQEYWSGLPCLPPGDLPDPGIKLASPALAADFFTPRATWESSVFIYLSWKLTRYLQRFFFLLCCTVYRILVPWPGIEPLPSPVETWILNHWTAREVPKITYSVSGWVLPPSWLLSLAHTVLTQSPVHQVLFLTPFVFNSLGFDSLLPTRGLFCYFWSHCMACTRT